MDNTIWAAAIAGAAGVGSHVFYFVRGEHHLSAPIVFRVYLVLIAVLYLIQWRLFGDAQNVAGGTVRLIAISYFGCLFSSILVYRFFFHKLRSFPGPIAARATKLYHASQVRKSDQYLFLERLHQKYGDFVRTGPNEITIFTPKAVPAIHGPGSECKKTAWYDNILPKQSVVTTRSRAAHDARRRVWDQGFSIKALQQQEGKILHHAQILESIVARTAGQPLNVTKYFEFFGFDVMADVGYNRSFDMLIKEKSHYAIEIFKAGTAVLGTLTAIPWFIHVMFSLPFVSRGWNIYSAWAEEELQLRFGKEPAKPDTMSWLIAAGKDDPDAANNHQWLLGDFITLVTGGTEPVVATIVYLFYHLAVAPAEVAKLRAEIEGLDSYSDTVKLQALPHLNGLIYETLRLHPPIPSGGLRSTPPSGITVGETYIPGGTTVLTPHYSLGRREDCFPQAAEFIPERWYSQPELIKDRTAFMPFGVGRFGCVGRNLGLMEIRTVTVVLMSKYDVSLAPGDDGSRLHRETLDCFAACPGKLELVFQKRK